MLGKLLKYDIKWQTKRLVPLYLIMLGSAAAIRIIDLFRDTFSFLNIFYGLLTVAFIFLIIIGFIYMAFTNIKRYIDSLFKDEGYLTHTLPVTKSNLLLTKFIMAILTFIVTIIVIILSISIAYLNSNIIDGIAYILDYLSMQGILKPLILFMILMIFEYFFYMFLIFTSISIGYSKNGNKNVNSVLWAIVIYFIVQAINLIYMGVISFMHPEVLTANNPAVAIDFLSNFVLGYLVFEIIYIGVFYYISYNRMNKHLNLP